MPGYLCSIRFGLAFLSLRRTLTLHNANIKRWEYVFLATCLINFTSSFCFISVCKRPTKIIFNIFFYEFYFVILYLKSYNILIRSGKLHRQVKGIKNLLPVQASDAINHKCIIKRRRDASLRKTNFSSKIYINSVMAHSFSVLSCF